MTLTKTMDVRSNMKKYFDLAFHGEPVLISRKKNENVAIVSEKDLNELPELRQQKHNMEYMAMLQKSMAEAEAGGFVAKSKEKTQ